MQGLTLKVLGDDGADLLLPLSPGDAGTEETIAAMRTLAREQSDSSQVRHLAARVRACAARSGREGLNADLAALFATWQRGIQFRRDPRGIEFIQRPDHFAAEVMRAMDRGDLAGGDCDDASTLGASTLLALGHRPVFITVGTDPAGDFEHVYFGAIGPRGVVPLDPQEVTTPGRQVVGIARRQVWEV